MIAMKKFSVLMLGLAVATAMASQSVATDKLAPIYAKLDSLSLKKDMAGLSKFLTEMAAPDCVFINKTGKKQTPKEILGDMGAQMNAIDKFVKSSSHIDKATAPKGGIIVATVTSTYSILTKKGPDGNAHKITGSSQSQDTWVKSGPTWKLKISKTIKETTLMDGKPLPG